ncbi:hypothetical protein LTS10_000149 [Elasticomyces elasticus]|nr:hypothetical protein LTS10_000149 [Elasticomyces elasticus]
MFLDPEPKRGKALTASPFLPPPMPTESAADQRWRVKRKPLHERTQSQNNQKTLEETNAEKPTIRLIQHSPTPSIQQRSSISDVDFDDIKIAKRISVKRYNSNGARARSSDSPPLVQEASAAEPGFKAASVSESINPTNETPKLHLPPSITLLPKSSTHAVPQTSWHRRGASSGNYSATSNSSTLKDGDTSLVASSSSSSERLSQGTTLRGTPTPYEQEHPNSIAEEEDSAQGPAHALHTLQEGSPEQTTVRAVPPSVASTITDDQSETTSPPSPPTADLPAECDNLPNVTQRRSRRQTSASDAPEPLPLPDASPPLPSQESAAQDSALQFDAFSEPSSPIVVIYDSDSTRPRSRSHPLRYASSLESIESRLQHPTVFRPETGHSLAQSSSWASLRAESSTDTLPPLQVLKKRSGHRPTSLSLGSISAFSSGSRMAEQEYDSLPYPRHQYSSHLSTIASESDRQSRSTSRQLSHFSLGSGVLTGDDASSIPLSGTWPRGRRGSAPIESTASDASPNVSAPSSEHEPGDMTLGIFREESAKPSPLKPRSPSAPGVNRKYDGPLPPIPPIPKSRDSDENWDTVSELQSPSLRPKRSGYSLRQRSNSTPSRSGSHSRQISSVSADESERWSHGSSLFPTWAKHFYGGGAALLSSSKISLGSHNTPRPTKPQHGRNPSQWTERSVASRLGTGYSEIETGSPTSSRFLPSIFRPRTRQRADTEGGQRKSNLRRSKRSRPSADTDNRPDSLAIFNDPLPESRDGARLPSGQPKYGELKDGPTESGQRPLPRKYSKQKHWNDMQFPRPMTKDRISDFAIEQPHLTPSKRYSQRMSNWRPPSFVESLDTLIHSRCNRQILLFALGFICPLLWMLAAALPLPHKPVSATDLEKSVGGSEEDVQMAMMKHEAGDAEKRWREEKMWLKARWWRTLNRIMSIIGVLVIGAVIALAVVATRDLTASMVTPVERVFGIAELLEAILLPVDMKTLLLSQRVSSVFRDTISTSPRLLEKLYLRQSPAPAVLPHLKDIINPLIAKNTINSIKYPDRLPNWTDARTGRDSTGLLFRPFDQALRIVLTALDLTPLTTPFYQQESDQIEASWLRMYL